MTTYKHTQIGYLILVVTLAVLGFFVWAYTMALAEPPSVDSGPNLLVTAVMVLIVAILASFCWLTVSIDETHVRVKFGWGIFQKKLLLSEIASVTTVKNPWYVGWGIRYWLWPERMWVYNISGFDAVQLSMKNGKIYRIGTDEPQVLCAKLLQQLS